MGTNIAAFGFRFLLTQINKEESDIYSSVHNNTKHGTCQQILTKDLNTQEFVPPGHTVNQH
jgi:hypothetical protein